jgi:PLAT/LH2 domain
VRVRHDDTRARPGWFLNKMSVRNEDTDVEWTLPCHRWLARDEDDGAIVRILDLS